MFHTIRNGIAHICAKATPKRLAIDVDSIHLLFPRLRNLKGFRERLFRVCKMFLLYVLLKEIFAGEAPFVHVAFETVVKVVHVEVSHVLDRIATEHAFSFWSNRTEEHTYPFSIVVAMHS
ncbi:hypothetical protein HBH56_041910 [Parastagonospora nodorum]|uniref:Uncharacterized protein n=2 Tax=Phaeosphaeria nodorum (strain SN15 / ATCC MYA-4574 / FGSC 10173) TaxID=321614 RepID=A0A7U2EW37_PHANO|nr:hypothetical protein SNOG_20092 [Parastagonospora nodorum SN15]KAH3917551.1 hypothetical protein HBH56_041910 [Parastagonospora nodorum]EDP89781.1 hypothetical protein SNOG_20092 [Parastagonospora nodorum SN15]KAH3933261.1 hypothetical protein HBH54_069660 [Parastagonospora nodorum]KAH3943377.1 hypothetical protein HBH53_173830 [Parastagonospora nodorum]KAH4004143.1 hypothetical protein HBI10_048700 [Parastagonospora nodorum]